MQHSTYPSPGGGLGVLNLTLVTLLLSQSLFRDMLMPQSL